MNREELLQILSHDHDEDWEVSHVCHDEALLAYIDDDEITTAFWSTTKWYA